MKIMIIDDEPLIRRSLERLFTKAGHTVMLAEDGLSGAQLWNRFDPDVAIVDVLMPGLSGPEVIAEVKPNPKTAIALISAFSGDYNPESVKQLGADVFIEKPIANIQDLLPVIENLWKSKNS